MTRRNQYPENPWPPGTFLAANWDLNRSVRDLGGVAAREAKADLARARQAGLRAKDIMRHWFRPTG